MKTRKLQPIIVSRATTAWGLLKATRQHMAEEPLRVDMSNVVYTYPPEDGGPPCGTVGCFAGNIMVKAGLDTSEVCISDVERLLGRTLDYDFFNEGTRHHVFNGGAGDACENTSPRTVEHQQAVLARADRFMAQNERALKQRKLPATGKGRMRVIERIRQREELE